MRHKLYIFILLLFLVSACKQKHTPEINFYYWKTNINITAAEKEYFENHSSGKLYIRFFDIDNTTGKPLPVAKIKPFNPASLTASYVPVVFITNRTFAQMDEEAVKTLAENTVRLITEIKEANAVPEFDEIQIDCDWTAKTRNNYFSFLTTLKELSSKEITSTLRLHQVKYRQNTGIPPVSKVYLMCYATSEPSDQTTGNSILSMQLLKDYTANVNDYPLKMDIALPLFSWGVVTNHIGKVKLINALTTVDLQNEKFRKTGENTYQVLEDTFLNGIYINKGFTIRIESITPELLKEAQQYLGRKLKDDYDIVYYHLDEKFLLNLEISNIKRKKYSSL